MRVLILLTLLALLLAEYRPALARPRLYGSPAFTSAVSAALDFVQSNGAAYSVRYISLVEEDDSPANYTGSHIVGDGTCKVEMSLAYATWKYDTLAWVGSDLVHEGSLCRDYYEGNTADVRADEIRALKAQRAFLVRVGAPLYLVSYIDTLIARGAPYLR